MKFNFKNNLDSRENIILFKNFFLFLPNRLKGKLKFTIFLTIFSSTIEAFVILAIYPLSLRALSFGIQEREVLKNPDFLQNIRLDFFTFNSTYIFVIFILLVILSFSLKISSNYKSLKISSEIGSFLSSELFKKEVNSDLDNFIQRDSSLISSSLIIGVNLIISSFINPFFNALQSICFITIILLSTLLFAPKTLLIGMFFIIFLYILIIIKVKRKVNNIGLNRTNLVKVLTKYINNLNENFRELFISNDNLNLYDDYKIKDYKFRILSAYSTFYSSFPKYFFESAILLILISILLISTKDSYFIIRNLPILITIALAVQKILPYLQVFYTSVINIISTRYLVKTYFDLTKRHKRFTKRKIYFPNNDIKMSYLSYKNVYFRYSSKEQYTLKNINIELKQGDNLYIFGPSGCGKSTLMDIMIGLRNNHEGDSFATIHNSKKIEKYDCCELRDLFSYIPQEGVIYDETILWNLLPYKNEINFDEIEEILNILELDLFINKLPNKLLTVCRDNGKIFSGGQRQRLLIARGILRNKEYLFGDEITSSLNNSLAKRIIVKLIRFQKKRNKSFILISHNDSLSKLFERKYELKK